MSAASSTHSDEQVHRSGSGSPSASGSEDLRRLNQRFVHVFAFAAEGFHLESTSAQYRTGASAVVAEAESERQTPGEAPAEFQRCVARVILRDQADHGKLDETQEGAGAIFAHNPASPTSGAIFAHGDGESFDEIASAVLKTGQGDFAGIADGACPRPAPAESAAKCLVNFLLRVLLTRTDGKTRRFSHFAKEGVSEPDVGLLAVECRKRDRDIELCFYIRTKRKFMKDHLAKSSLNAASGLLGGAFGDLPVCVNKIDIWGIVMGKNSHFHHDPMHVYGEADHSRHRHDKLKWTTTLQHEGKHSLDVHVQRYEESGDVFHYEVGAKWEFAHTKYEKWQKVLTGPAAATELGREPASSRLPAWVYRLIVAVFEKKKLDEKKKTAEWHLDADTRCLRIRCRKADLVAGDLSEGKSEASKGKGKGKGMANAAGARGEAGTENRMRVEIRIDKTETKQKLDAQIIAAVSCVGFDVEDVEDALKSLTESDNDQEQGGLGGENQTILDQTKKAKEFISWMPFERAQDFDINQNFLKTHYHQQSLKNGQYGNFDDQKEWQRVCARLADSMPLSFVRLEDLGDRGWMLECKNPQNGTQLEKRKLKAGQKNKKSKASSQKQSCASVSGDGAQRADLAVHQLSKMDCAKAEIKKELETDWNTIADEREIGSTVAQDGCSHRESDRYDLSFWAGAEDTLTEGIDNSPEATRLGTDEAAEIDMSTIWMGPDNDDLIEGALPQMDGADVEDTFVGPDTCGVYPGVPAVPTSLELTYIDL